MMNFSWKLMVRLHLQQMGRMGWVAGYIWGRYTYQRKSSGNIHRCLIPAALSGVGTPIDGRSVTVFIDVLYQKFYFAVFSSNSIFCSLTSPVYAQRVHARLCVCMGA